MTPTDDLSARLRGADVLHMRMLSEMARPVPGSPEGVAWLAAEAYREVAHAALTALSALPAAGGEVAGQFRPAWLMRSLADLEKIAQRFASAGDLFGQVKADACATRLRETFVSQIDPRPKATTPQPSAAEGEVDYDMAMHWIDRYAVGLDYPLQLDRVCDALGVPEPPEDYSPTPNKSEQADEPKCPECSAALLYECVACSATNYPPPDAAVGAQGDGYPNTSDVPDSELREQLSACRDDWQRLCDAVEPGQHFDPDDLIRRLASPAAGKGVDDGSWLNVLPARKENPYSEPMQGPSDHDEWTECGEIIGWNSCLDALTRQPVAGDGMVLVPRELTAENGAKAALSGEFCEHVEIRCAECNDGMLDDDTPCDDCDGRGSHRVKVLVEWDTLKSIHKAMVAHFAAPAATPTDGGEGS